MNRTGGTGVTLDKWMADPMNASSSNSSMPTPLRCPDSSPSQNYQNQIESPVQGIQSAFNDVAHQTEVTNPNSGKSVQVRIWGTSPNTPWAYVEAVTNQNFGGKATAGNRVASP